MNFDDPEVRKPEPEFQPTTEVEPTAEVQTLEQPQVELETAAPALMDFSATEGNAMVAPESVKAFEDADLEDEGPDEWAEAASSPIDSKEFGAKAGEPATPIPTQVAPKKMGFFSRIRQSFRGRFGKKTEAVTQEVASPIFDEAQLRDRLAANIDFEAEAQAKIAGLESENYAKQMQIEANKETIADLQAFIAQVERTYIWHIQTRMKTALANATREMETYESAVRDVKTPDEGRLLALRKQFHKAVSYGFFISGVIALFTILIPMITLIETPTWLASLLSSTFFTSLMVGLWVIIVTIQVIRRKKTGAEKVPTRRIVWTNVIMLLVNGMIVAWPFIQVFVAPLIVAFLTAFVWQILTACASLFGTVLVAALLVYYRGWSIFRRDVTEQVARLEHVIEGYVHTRQEIGRLTSLHAQTSEWLKILAHSLYRPWKTDPQWDSTRELASQVESFPFALRIAQAQENGDAQIAELERLVGARLLVPGWRADAFNDLVAKAGLEMGLQDGQFVVDTLDKDLPHQTNNSRNLLMNFLEHSAETESQGVLDNRSDSSGMNEPGTKKASDRYLIEVARERLRDLIEQTQTVILSQARPRVLPLRKDPLRDFQEDFGGIEETDGTLEWDEFLMESLGTGGLTHTQMGSLNFTDEARARKVHESPSTFVLLPQRLAGKVPDSKGSPAQLIPLGDGRSRPTELITRLDVIGPVDLQDIMLLSSKTPKAPQEEAAPVEDEDDL